MNQKRLFCKLLALVACLMSALGASAAEAYACYTSSDKTLTFYYDNYRSSRPGTTYDMNTGYSTPAWFLDTHETLVAVTFDATFKNARPTSTYSWFYTMPNLRRINNIGNLNTSSVTVMQNMFNGCSSLYYLDLSNFNTANVTDMSIMFSDCSNLTVIDLSGFNTSKVTSMGSMFQNCSNLTTIYAGSGWNTVALTNSGFMFRNCTSLVGGQGTTFQSSNPTNKTYAHIDGGPSNPGYFTDGSAPMPYACYTSSNKTLTFYYDTQRRSRTGTTYFMNTRDIRTGWYIDDLNANVTKVVFNSSFADARPTSMYMWFYEMFSLQSITGINYLNTSEVTNMAFTFSNCEKLTSLDVSHFNTDKVTTMQYMFIDCPKLTSLDLSGFNTAGVTDMEGLFLDCSNLTTIYAGSGWSTDGVTASNTAYMFADCYSLVGGQGTAYDENHTGKDYAHIDGGPSNPGYFTAGTEAYACYTPSNTTMTFYYDNLRYSRTGTTFALNSGANFPAWFDGSTNENVTKVVFNSSFADARPTTTHGWFDEMYELTSVQGIENLNTSEVTDMAVMFGDCGELTAVDVSHFDTRKVTTMAYMFYYCSALTSLDVRGFDTGNVTDMSGMFEACAGLTALDVTNFNTVNVTDMYGMFEDCDGLTILDLGNFNTSRVTDMRHMFSYCDKLRTIYVGNGWSTAAVTSSDYMFYESPSLVGGQGTTYDENHVDAAYAHIDGGESNPGYFTDANAPRPYACYSSDNTTLTFYCDDQHHSRPGTFYYLNTGNNWPGWYEDDTYKSVTQVVFDASFADVRPTSTHCWFCDMKKLQAITGMEYLNTSQVTNMTSMFYGCSGLTSLDLSNFNTSQVTNMTFMFYRCSGLTSLNLSNFNTSQVTKFVCMFYGCSGLTSLDLSNFNTSQATDFGSMFWDCSGLTRLDLSNFNTSQVTNMSLMFSYCDKLRTIYVGSDWTTDAVTDSEYSKDMFENCTSLVGGMGTTYDENHVDKEYAHIDGGESNPGYFTDTNAPRAYACYTPDNTTLSFYYDDQHHSRPGTFYYLNTGENWPGWYTDYTNESVTQAIFDPSFAEARPTSTFCWFNEMENLLSITGMEFLNTSNVTNMCSMFGGCSHLTSLDVSNFNTSNVTNMHLMFAFCKGLTSLDVSNFNTSNVTRMDALFEFCSGLTSLDVSNFNTSNVTDMSYLFAYCNNLTSIDVSNFNTSNVTAMYYMFCSCDNLTSLDVSNFNTSEVKYMDCMFAYCSGLTSLDVSNFNTSNVTNMEGMFKKSTGLTSLDVSNFDTSNVTNMTNMFYDCTGLTSLDLSNFNTSNVTEMRYMFESCSSLTSLDLSNFNTENVWGMTDMFDGCSNLTTIYAGNGFTTDAVTNYKDMFKNCTSLVGGQGTTYDANHIDKEYAHIDGGPSNPGYFTSKSLRGDVNFDGRVNIDDVTDLINYLLTGNTANVDLLAADCYLDGRINIDDVTALINYLLSNKW